MGTGRNLQETTLGKCSLPNKVLVIAPHPDDEVLGCGGTIARHAADGDEVYAAVVTKGPDFLFPAEETRLTREQCVEADQLLGVKETIFLDFPSVILETVPRHELNGKIAGFIQEVQPDIVYIPHRGDMQLDHKLVVDACMVALRPKYSHVPKTIYAYETLSETGWDIPNAANEFIPTVYRCIDDYIDRKLEAVNLFRTQLAEYPNARSLESVKALAMYRGSTVGFRYAEAFYIVRQLLD